MGTNYYVKTGNKLNVTCNYGFDHEMEEELHIGKNSYGWLFSLHIIPEKGINELKDWIPILWRGKIKNEYGEEIKISDMIKIILKDEKSKLLEMSEQKREEYLRKMNRNSFFEKYRTVVDEKSGLLRIEENRKGKEGNYCLVEGEFC